MSNAVFPEQQIREQLSSLVDVGANTMLHYRKDYPEQYDVQVKPKLDLAVEKIRELWEQK